MTFSIKNFFRKWDQIRSFLRIWSQLLKKSLMENFIFLLLAFFKNMNVSRNIKCQNTCIKKLALFSVVF